MSNKIHLVRQVGTTTVIGAFLLSTLLSAFKLLGWVKWSWWIASFPIWFIVSVTFIITILSLIGMGFISVLAYLLSK